MHAALLKVATGFQLAFFGLVVVVLAVVALFVGMCIIVAVAVAQGGIVPGGAIPPGIQADAEVLVTVVVGVAVVGSLIGLVGRFLCLAVPDEAGAAKSRIVVSVVLEVLGILCNIINTADNAGGNFLTNELKLAIGLGGVFALVSALVLFVLFARALAGFVGRSDLATRAVSVIWLAVATVVCYGGATALMLAGAPGAGGAVAAAGCAGALLALAALVFAFVALILYALLLLGMRSALRRYARRDASGDDGYEDEYDDRGDEYDDRNDRSWDRG